MLSVYVGPLFEIDLLQPLRRAETSRPALGRVVAAGGQHVGVFVAGRGLFGKPNRESERETGIEKETKQSPTWL